MYLSLREIWFARTRFVVMAGVLALMSLLIVIISGLSAGLVNDGVSALKNMDANAVVFDPGTKSDSAFTRSSMPLTDVDTWQNSPEVADAAPLGVSMANAKNADGSPVDLAVFGIEPESFIAPTVAEGRPVEVGSSGIVVSETLRDEGVALGDILTLDRLGTQLEVVGFTADQRTFGHVAVAYAAMPVWQKIHAGVRAGETARPGIYDDASVIVLRAADAKDFDVAALSDSSGMSVRTMSTAFESSPGYLAESMTMNLIQWFLYAISALVTGAFFLVWTIQRSGDIAVMRAMGATRGMLLRDSLGQALVVLVSAIAAGVAVALAMATWLSSTAMPFAIDAARVSAGTVALFIFGLIGAFAAVLRVTRTDPLTALGENR